MRNEKTSTNNLWNPNFHLSSKSFGILSGLLKRYAHQLQGQSFPDYQQYNQVARIHYADCHLTVGQQVCFEPQKYIIPFEQNVVQNKKVYTREECWHDFFNNLTWLLWPNSKWATVAQSVTEGNEVHNKNRTSKQSFLAQLDECGMLVVTSKKHLIQDLQKHKWLDLFYHKRFQLKSFEVITYGHGLLEKCLDPYVGMTGKAVIIWVKDKYFSLPSAIRLQFLDQLIANWIHSKCCPSSAKNLQPFPVLGMPGWYKGNEKQKFYRQTAYFRPARNVDLKFSESIVSLDKNLWGQWQFLAPDG